MTAEVPQGQERRTNASSARIYYTYSDAKVQGPYSIRELVKMRNAKELKLDTPCCIQGGKEWQTVEVLLTHKLGKRRLRRVQRSTLTSFSRKTLPTIFFVGLGLLAIAMGAYMATRTEGTVATFGFVLIPFGFGLFLLAYFIHPKSEN
jgi:hypothetical protein